MHKTFLLFFSLFILNPLGAQIRTGAEQLNSYLPFLRDKKIALVVNQTSRVGETHLVDTLLSHSVQIQALFAPEHGIRGDHGAGENVKSVKDPQTGLPIISLYGSHKKPTREDLKGVGLVVFDIQDVGARFYTYISTLHYVMEACAEQGIPVLVLDRPNPNGHYVDGPVLDTAHRSFVGMHPIPVVHGMTIGEYAQMINGEGWLKGGIQCSLEVIPVLNYTHQTPYEVPVAPSPNLPNELSIKLYPSLCFFEGTNVSLGRGTETPFQVFGSPYFITDSENTLWDTSFIPVSMPHSAPNPPHKGVRCYGTSFRRHLGDTTFVFTGLDLDFLLKAYLTTPDTSKFFNDFFVKLAGTGQLQKDIEAGKSEETIRASWQPGLDRFKEVRGRYLLYE